MRSMIATAIVAVLATTACSQPFLLLSGDALDGTVTPAPDDWSFSDDVGTIQLETRPTEPYSVNLWVVALDDALFVLTKLATNTAPK